MVKFYKSTAKSPLHQPPLSVFPLGAPLSLLQSSLLCLYLKIKYFIEFDGRTWLISGHNTLNGGVLLRKFRHCAPNEFLAHAKKYYKNPLP